MTTGRQQQVACKQDGSNSMCRWPRQRAPRRPTKDVDLTLSHQLCVDIFSDVMEVSSKTFTLWEILPTELFGVRYKRQVEKVFGSSQDKVLYRMVIEYECLYCNYGWFILIKME